MKVGPVNGLITTPLSNETAGKINDSKFKNVFTDFVTEVNASSMKANQLTEDLINGKDVQLHEVMIAGEEAKTNLQLLVEIRNKAVDMYKELTRMQA